MALSSSYSSYICACTLPLLSSCMILYIDLRDGKLYVPIYRHHAHIAHSLYVEVLSCRVHCTQEEVQGGVVQKVIIKSCKLQPRELNKTAPPARFNLIIPIWIPHRRLSSNFHKVLIPRVIMQDLNIFSTSTMQFSIDNEEKCDLIAAKFIESSILRRHTSVDFQTIKNTTWSCRHFKLLRLHEYSHHAFQFNMHANMPKSPSLTSYS